MPDPIRHRRADVLGDYLRTRRTEIARIVQAAEERMFRGCTVTQQDMADLIGVSLMSIRRAELGQLGASPTRKLCRGLDLGYQWEPGSTADILEGGSPTVREVDYDEVLRVINPALARYLQDVDDCFAALTAVIHDGLGAVPPSVADQVRSLERVPGRIIIATDAKEPPATT